MPIRMHRDLAHLAGKRVLVTCSVGGAEELLLRLREAGADPVSIPLVEIRDPADGFIALDAAIAKLAAYAWVALTSRNGVAAFFARLGDCPPLATIRFAAVGPGTAEALSRHGVVADVVAQRHDAEGLAAALAPKVKEGDRILWPHARDAREIFAEALRNGGAVVDEVEAYQTAMPDGIDRNELMRVVERNGVAAVLFDSPSAVRNFVEIVGREHACIFAQKVDLIPIGPVTSAAIKHALV